MSWSLDHATGVWKCTRYSDLAFVEVNNLAEYGQPYSPYEPGFDPDFVPDFAKVVVEMPQAAVMKDGYGRDITAESFPVVQRFLHEQLTLPVGTYFFKDLVKHGFTAEGDRWIYTSLYGGGFELPVITGVGSWLPVVRLGGYGISPGTLTRPDAAYIHGTVRLALMADTKFLYAQGERRVKAFIGAGSDNWDFESSTIPPAVEAAVATLFGPDHYNLEAPITINFTGNGRYSEVRRRPLQLTSPPWPQYRR